MLVKLWGSLVACSGVNELNIFQEIWECFHSFSCLFEIFYCQSLAFVSPISHTWLHKLIITAICFLNFRELDWLPIVNTVMRHIWLITRVAPFHYPYHFIEQSNIISLNLCLSLFLFEIGLAVSLVVGWKGHSRVLGRLRSFSWVLWCCWGADNAASCFSIGFYCWWEGYSWEYHGPFYVILLMNTLQSFPSIFTIPPANSWKWNMLLIGDSLWFFCWYIIIYWFFAIMGNQACCDVRNTEYKEKYP